LGTDGKLRVVYAGAANNIVPNDNNGKSDIFLTTLVPGAPGAAPAIESVERINLGPGGVEADGESQGPSISPNGMWISFDSMASNLVPGDNNAANDVFAFNVESRLLYRVSVAQSPAIEGTGASFASSIANDGTTSFTSYNALAQGATTVFQQVYVRKTPAASPSTVLVSVNSGGTSSSNAPSLESTISADGTKVTFTTNADDVVPGKTKGIPDIVFRDLSGNQSRLVSVNGKAGAGMISADGGTVAFIAEAIGTKKGIYKVGVNGTAGPGNFVADCNSATCASKPKAAVLPSISADGSMLAFQSAARYAGGPGGDWVINSDQIWFGTSSTPLLISQGASQGQANNGAANPSVSPDGRWVTFESAADNLVGDDFNGAVDIFLAQVGTAGPATMTRVSVPAAGGEASGFATAPSAPAAVSADGNIIAFGSDSSNLVDGDTNGVSDIFVRDRAGGRTERVSVGNSAMGKAQANAGSFKPSISADGRFVAFESAASNLVPGDGNGVVDVFVHDRQGGETIRVSDTPGASASRNPAISANGAWVAFESTGSFDPVVVNSRSILNVFRWGNPAAGGDGQFKMVSTQPPDPTRNNTNRTPGGKPSYDPSVANDGSVAFLSDSTGLTGFDGDDPPGAKPNYTDVYVALSSGSVVKASMSNSTGGDGRPLPAAGDSYDPAISADGTKVAFASDATNLPTTGADQNPDTDVFVRDIPGSSVRLVNGAPNGVPGGASTAPAINADGSAVAFVSTAPNLVASDNNGAPDVFLTNMGNGGISKVSVRPGADGHQADGPSYMPGISGNGLVIAFGSSAANLVDGDNNQTFDVFIRSLTELPSPCVGCGGRGGQAFSGPGYRFVAADGGIFSFGDAKFHGSAGATTLAKPIVGMASSPTNAGYWLVASDGGIFSYGDAKFFGSTGALRLNSPIVGMTASPSGQGYWFVAADGGIFSFGDAKFFGSMGGEPLAKPIVGMASTPSGKGYWLVASDGGIFSFGDAKFFGSTGDIKLTRPIVGMDRTNSGNGYRFVASDGGIFSFGDAAFLGSMGGKPLAKPIVGMARTRTGDGYWLVASDGGIFSFGNAGFQGSTGDIKLAQPIVGMAG
jgi:Tol biopolymer transport system component